LSDGGSFQLEVYNKVNKKKVFLLWKEKQEAPPLHFSFKP
jgi:hypothetical protein